MERRIKGKVKGKAIIGIAVAAIMLASLMAVLPGMSMEQVIKIPVPPDDGKIQISPDEYIGKEVVLVAEQLALAGTPVLIEGKSGWMVKEVLGVQDVYPLGMHEIKVVFEQGDMTKDRLMKVLVVDTKAPVIQEKVSISENEAMYSISVKDDCDAAPMVDAVIMLPLMDDLKITQKAATEVEVEIDLKEMTAVLKGPAKVRAMMRKEGMMQVMMNEKMLRDHEIVITVEREDIKNGVKYKYRANGRTLVIEGDTDADVEVLEMRMMVKAMDASDNPAEREVMLDWA